MKISVICATAISDAVWIETQLIDCVFELFPISKVHVAEGKTGSIPGTPNTKNGNEIVARIFKSKHYEVEEFPYSFSEFGLGAIHKRNLDMMAECEFCLVLTDGASKTCKNIIDICLWKKMAFNVRYYK